MSFLDIIMGLIAVGLVYLLIEDPFRVRIFFGRVRINIKSWYKWKINHWTPWKLDKPIDLVILSESYWKDVAEVASQWTVLPYDKSERVQPARCRKGFFGSEKGYLVVGFFLDWPAATDNNGQPPAMLVFQHWLDQTPIENVFIPRRDWEAISKNNWDGFVIRVRERRRVSSRVGTYRMMVFDELVKSLSKNEIAKLKAVDDFVA